MTEAKSTAKTRVGVYIDGTWEWLKEVKAVPAMGTTASTLDATHLESEAREYIPDIPDQSGSLDFTLNAMPTGASESNYDLIQRLDAAASYPWKIEFPQLGYGWAINAYWNWGTADMGVSSVADISLSLIPNGAPVSYKIAATYTVTYDANGGSGTVTDSTAYTNGQTVTVKPATGVTKTGSTFVRWNVRADGTGTGYDPNDTFTAYNDVTLYAVWRASS